MEKKIRIYNLIAALLIFVGLPFLLWVLGDFPRRTLLKETISLLSILAFCLMLGQFFLARSNSKILKEHKMAGVLKIHKFIGYFFTAVLILHPFLIVFPRYFESGITPVEAFTTILSSYSNTGVFLGIGAYFLMLVLGLTSLFRNSLGLKYKTWRVFHGFLSIAFITMASWHALLQGRHMNLPMSILVLTLAASGIILLLRTYIKDLIKKKDNE